MFEEIRGDFPERFRGRRAELDFRRHGRRVLTPTVDAYVDDLPVMMEDEPEIFGQNADREAVQSHGELRPVAPVVCQFGGSAWKTIGLRRVVPDRLLPIEAPLVMTT